MMANDEIMDDYSNEIVDAIVDRDDALRALDAAIARAEAAEARVAELKAATAWRLVTEPPEREGQYQTYCGDRCYDLHMWVAGRWYDGSYGRTPTHWRPLLPPPDATP